MVVVQVMPVQLQWWIVVVLDHDARWFMGSSMVDLKVNRMSDSVDEDEVDDDALMVKVKSMSVSESV